MCLGLFEEDVAMCIKSTLQWIKKGIKNPNPSNLPCDPVLRCFELSCATHNPRFCSPLCPTLLFGYVDPSSNLIFNVKYYIIDSWFKEDSEKIGEVAENQPANQIELRPPNLPPSLPGVGSMVDQDMMCSQCFSVDWSFNRVMGYDPQIHTLKPQPPSNLIKWRRKLQPTPIFLLGEPHGQWSLAGYSP